MKRKMRKQFGKEFKAKVAVSAIKEDKTLAELSSIYGVHSTQINTWKKSVLAGVADLFSNNKQAEEKEREALIENLYKNIGQLKVENDWLKKKLMI